MGDWNWIGSRRAWMWIGIPIAVITTAHYLTPHTVPWAHHVLRRLYYIPIIVGAFLYGTRGSLATAVVSSLAYLPHALGWTHHHDPGEGIEKFLEVALYVVVGLVTGVLADRERRERERQTATAQRLSEALDDVRAMESQLIRSGRLQALGEMTAGLAHEIRNPLASLRGAADIIADEIPETSPRRRMVEILRKEFVRLDELLTRFLTFAKPEDFVFQKVRPAECVERVLALLDTRLRQDGIRWSFDCAEPEIEINADASKIEQVLLNLFLNAAQAMPSGGDLGVRLSRSRRGRREYVEIAVADSGPGVPAEVREKIFDPFFTTRDGGTGLGLSVAARVVDQHGGLIEVSENPGGGAVFTVCLPSPDVKASEIR